MNQFEITAEMRDDIGRGASRRLRRAGRLPGIIYGAEADATPISLNHDDIAHHLEHEAFYSHILTLKLGKEKQKVVLKDLQRHPYKARLLHIDLLRVSDKEKLTMRIPIHFLNEEKCVGVKQGGGIVSRIMSELEVECLPKDLPEYIEIDLLEMDIGDSVHLSEVKLPEGVVSYIIEHGGDASSPVVSVHLPRLAAEDEEVEETEDADEIAGEAVETRAEEGDEKEDD